MSALKKIESYFIYYTILKLIERYIFNDYD